MDTASEKWSFYQSGPEFYGQGQDIELFTFCTVKTNLFYTHILPYLLLILPLLPLLPFKVIGGFAIELHFLVEFIYLKKKNNTRKCDKMYSCLMAS